MSREKDLKMKEVIDISEAERLGYIKDMDIDPQSGCIRAVIVPRRPYFLSALFRGRCRIIPWEDIVKIGRELVLADCSRQKEPEMNEDIVWKKRQGTE